MARALATAVFMLACLPAMAFAAEDPVAFAGGDGTKDNPYLVQNEAQLRAIDNDLAASYKLTADIQLTGEWTPIASNGDFFTGVLDGDGHVVSGLRVESTRNYAGFFAGISGGQVENLGLQNVVVNGGNYAGAIAGYLSRGAISRCWVSGAVSGDDSVGGLVGGLDNGGLIDSCYSTAQVSGTATSIGGIAGFIRTDSSVTLCYSTGTIQGNQRIGGIVGNVDNGQQPARIVNCVALGREVVAASGKEAGRVAGAVSEPAGTSFAGNYAFEDMVVGLGDVVLDKGADKKDGANATGVDVADSSWWNGLTYLAAPLGAWTFAPAQLPTLMGESSPIPDYLAPAAFLVTFDAAGGSAVAAQTVRLGDMVQKPADPVKDGFVFGGWFKDAALATPWNFDADVVLADTTLYAKWTAAAPVYAERMLVDSKSQVQVSGKMTEDAVLEVMPLSSGAAYDNVLAGAALAENDVLSVFEVRLAKGSFEGQLRLLFTVDRKYDGKTVSVRHLKADGSVDTLLAECANGKVAVSVSELSPFALTAAKPASLPQDDRAKPEALAKTGDSQLMTFAFAAACAAGGVLVMLGAGLIRRRG